MESRILEATPEEVYRALMSTDFLDVARESRIVTALFAIRTAIERVAGAIFGRKWVPPPEPPSMLLANIKDQGEWVKLGENAPWEIAFGAVGQFWAGETRWRTIDGSQFAAFGEPGHAKIACHLLIEPLSKGRCRLSYEARTIANDDATRKAFLRYWRVVSPMVGLVMRATLSLITRTLESDALLNQFMPVFDVVERHQIRIEAPVESVFQAACAMDAGHSPLVRAIIRAREWILRSKPSEELRGGLVEQTKRIGWGELACERDHEIVMGAITQPWEADVRFRPIEPSEFKEHREPGHVKIAWTLRADRLHDSSSLLRTETRVVACDAEARTRFRWYWRIFSPGIVLIRRVLLARLKRQLECNQA